MYVVAPLTKFQWPDLATIDLGAGARMAAGVPEWIKREENILNALHLYEDLEVISSPIIECERESAVAGDLARSATGELDYGLGPQAVLERVLCCLWIVRPNQIRPKFCLVFPKASRPANDVGYRADIAAPILLPGEGDDEMTGEDFKETRNLHEYFSEVDSGSRLDLAIRTLASAVGQRDPHIRIPLLWSTLECLFGDQGVELSYRVCLRIALFLERGAEGRDLHRRLKKSYDARSALVHGSADRVKQQKMADAVVVAEPVVRRAIRKIVASRELRDRFNSPQKGEVDPRREFLEELAFGLW